MTQFNKQTHEAVPMINKSCAFLSVDECNADSFPTFWPQDLVHQVMLKPVKIAFMSFFSPILFVDNTINLLSFKILFLLCIKYTRLDVRANIS